MFNLYINGVPCGTFETRTEALIVGAQIAPHLCAFRIEPVSTPA
jgi:hypothetical protein